MLTSRRYDAVSAAPAGARGRESLGLPPPPTGLEDPDKPADQEKHWHHLLHSAFCPNPVDGDPICTSRLTTHRPRPGGDGRAVADRGPPGYWDRSSGLFTDKRSR